MKIGIFGGSFNPIHTGHAIIANYVTQYTDIEQVWLMVSPQNPLKDQQTASYDIHRLAMAELVASKCDNVITSGLEFTLPRPSYTINTLNVLREKFPEHEFVLIVGADNWQNFHKWKDYLAILKSHSILVYPRIGFDIVIPDEYRNRVSQLGSPIIEISSTFIREQLKDNRNMNFYLPQDVYRYILEKGLYR